MAGTITALQIQKNNTERVNVYVDNAYAFAVTLVVADTLHKGQPLTDADIARLQAQDDRDKAYDQVVRWLAQRPHSVGETETYLRRKGHPAEVIAEVIARLQDKHYLDDAAFAEFWRDSRERFRPRGTRALRYELQQKGVARDVIDSTLSDLDESESAWAAIEPKLRTWHHLERDMFYKKALGFLSRRGFTYEVAQAICNRAWLACHSNE